MTYQTVTDVSSTGDQTESQEMSTVQTCWPERPTFGETYTAIHTAHAVAPNAPGSVVRERLKDHKHSWKYPRHDPSSFKKIKQSGLIKMTNYSVGEISWSYPLVVTSHRAESYGKYHPNRNEGGTWKVWWAWDGQKCNVQTYPNLTPVIARTEWTRTSDVRDFKSLSHYNLSGDLEDQLSRSIESVKSDVVVSLQKQWDALTDLAEARATAQTGLTLLRRVLHPLRTARAALSKMQSLGASNKAITQEWLQYRYGILPVIYSAMDIMELLEKAEDKYRTVRARRILTYPTGDTGSLPNSSCTYSITEGRILVNATGKAMFRSPSARRMHQTSLNIVNTAWELIPYSLVVDWFTNFGDFLYARTSFLNQFSADAKYCYAIRIERETKTFVQLIGSNQLTVDGWPSLSYDYPTESHHLIERKRENTYQRLVFEPSDVRLTFDPKFGSWKRWADAYALSINPLTQALRRLR